MGAAAARHLAKDGHQVVLIGPGEPADKRSHPGVFASHYDEGRITRRNALDPWWAGVSIASIDRYAEIEHESGISFFTATGAMMAGGPDWLARVDVGRQQHQIACDRLDGAALAIRFPFFRFPPGFAGYHEPDRAGHVSPRRLVAAQTEAARRHGAQIVAAEVASLGPGWVQTGDSRIEADQVLVAAGAWTDALLGRKKVLDVYARTVALFEISKAEADRLHAMPTLVYDAPEDPYLLPPIRYPDGKLYLKLGGDPVDKPLTSDQELAKWFRSGGDTRVREHLEGMLRALMPDLKVERVRMDACVTSWTPDRRPEIRRLDAQLTVCTGGNGAGAKCSDELGRLGAKLATMEEGVFA